MAKYKEVWEGPADSTVTGDAGYPNLRHRGAPGGGHRVQRDIAGGYSSREYTSKRIAFFSDRYRDHRGWVEVMAIRGRLR